MSHLPAIILAAGMSQRMGVCKQTLLFNGKPLLAHLLEALQGVEEISPIIVVTGRYRAEIAPLILQYGAMERYNSNYETGGMLSSIQVGVAALPADCRGFLYLLGDQPFVTAEALRALIAASEASDAPVVQPVCEGKRGHPILFRGSCIPEIAALPADSTLKTLMARHAQSSLLVPVQHPETLADMDSPADYEAAARLFAERRANS